MEKPREWTLWGQTEDADGWQLGNPDEIIHVLEAVPTLAILRQAREALLMAAPSIDQRSKTWEEMKAAVDRINEVLSSCHP